AYDYYLRGRFAVTRRTTPAFFEAIRNFEAAVRADSNMAAAWTGLAIVYGNLAGLYFHPDVGISRDSLNAMSRRAAEHAIRIDSNAIEALTARAGLSDPAHSIGLFRRIIALAPRDAGAHHNMALSLRILGHDSEALAEFHRALELEPGRAITLLNLGQ